MIALVDYELFTNYLPYRIFTEIFLKFQGQLETIKNNFPHGIFIRIFSEVQGTTWVGYEQPPL